MFSTVNIFLFVVVLLVVAWIGLRIYRAGRDKERVRNLEASNKKWVEADDIIGKAQDARRHATGPNADILSDDGFKRPRRDDGSL